MSFVKLRCPRCGQSLTASENAPRRLTCPKCLSPIDNPGAASLKGRVPVIPLEQQATSDTFLSHLMVLLLLAIVAFGILLVLMQMGLRAALGPIALSLAVAGLCVYISFALKRSSEPMGSRGPRNAMNRPDTAPMPVGSTLQYQPRQQFRQEQMGGATHGCLIVLTAIGAVIGLVFLLLLGLCGAIIIFAH
jgi:ribosomal protein S27E